MATNPLTGYKKKTIPGWLKRKVNVRDNFTCQICGKVGKKDSVRGLAYEYDGYIDWDCTMPKPVRFEIDHIKPEYLGGETTEENLQLVCRKCNRSKGYRKCS